MPKTSFAALALAAAIAAPGAAAEPAAGDIATRSVTYGDLDLSSPGGLKALNRRVERAAREVCGAGRTMRQSIAAERDLWTCVSAAKARAAQQIAALEDRGAIGG